MPKESGRPLSRRATISCALTVYPGATHGWDGVSGGAYYDIGANSGKGGTVNVIASAELASRSRELCSNFPAQPWRRD